MKFIFIHSPTNHLPTYLTTSYVCMHSSTYLIFWPGLQTHLLLLLPFVLRLLSCFPSEIIWYYGSYSQLVGRLLGGVISSVARPLTYTGQHKHGRNAKEQPCLKWESNLRLHISVGEAVFHALDRQTTVSAMINSDYKLPRSWRRLLQPPPLYDETICMSAIPLQVATIYIYGFITAILANFIYLYADMTTRSSFKLL